MASEATEFDPHKWKRYKCLPWDVCAKCGLIALHNAITAWCIRMGCNYNERSDWRATLYRLTRA